MEGYLSPASFKICCSVPLATSCELCLGTAICPVLVGCLYKSWREPFLCRYQPSFLRTFSNSEIFINGKFKDRLPLRLYKYKEQFRSFPNFLEHFCSFFIYTLPLGLSSHPPRQSAAACF